MKVVVVKAVRARRQYRGELLACPALNVEQKSLLFRPAMPAVLDRYRAAVGQYESGDVERVAKGMFGNLRVRIAVHAAAGISRDLLDLDHRLAEPAQSCRLHIAGDPLIERGHDRAGKRRRGLDLDRTD